MVKQVLPSPRKAVNQISTNSRIEPPARADRPLSIWQAALLVHGCHVNSADQLFPVELQAVGDLIFCTATASGSMLPFHVRVTVGQLVTIAWDSERSRYIVTSAGKPVAA